MKFLFNKFVISIIAVLLIGLGFNSFLSSRFTKKAIAADPWYDNNWLYRELITINHTKVSATETDFTVMVSKTHSNLRTTSNGGYVGKTNGGDILFTDASGTTKIPHEIETYVASTGELLAWVKVPSLSATVDTKLYMYYGNAGATDQWTASGANWNSNFLVVHHMKNATTTTILDSTSQGNNGTKFAVNEPIEATGRFGQGQAFDGVNDRINSGGATAGAPIATLTTNASFDAWVKPNAGYGNTAPRIIDKGKFSISMDTTGRVSGFVMLGGTNRGVSMVGTIPINTWSRVTVTFDNSLGSNQLKLYINGVLNNQSSFAGTIDSSVGTNLHLGDIGLGTRVLNGTLDEIRISNNTITPQWLTTSQNNLADPSTFMSFGTTECDGAFCFPSVPLNLTATAQDGQVFLDWDTPSSFGISAITDYVVQYRTGTNAYAVFADGISTTTSATVTSLSNGVSYDFRVAASNATGAGDFTSAVGSTPISSTPTVPVASGVGMSGYFVVGQVITGGYTFSDVNNDSEGSSTYQWYRSDTSNGTYTAISGATSIEYRLTSQDEGKFIKFEITPVANSAPTTGSPVQSSASTAIAPQWPIMNHILSTGQSLSLGSHGTPPLSTTQPYQNKGLVSGVIVPLVENPNETISSAMANFLTWRSSGLSFQSIVTLHGVGGTAYAGLKKGTAPYQNGMNQVTTVKDLLAGQSIQSKVVAVTNIHGEANSTVSADTYKGYLVEWQNDYNTDVKAITKQLEDIPMFTDQMNSYTALSRTTSGVPIGQLLAAEENPSKIYLVTPKYFFPYDTDGVHMTNTSYRWLGEYYGKAMKKVLIDGQQWKPLSPTTITRKDNVILAKFHVPSGQLTLDTTLVMLKENYGFEYFDNSSNPPDITQVELVGTDTVKITLESAPTGTNQRLRYAYTGVSGADAGPFEAGSARGNLRDTDNTPSQYGNTLYNWAVTFDKALVVDTTAPTGTITINNGDDVSTTSEVALQLTATDNFSGNTELEMQLSRDNSFDDTNWEVFSETKNWTLNIDKGIETVYFRVRDRHGNISSTYSDSIEANIVNVTTFPSSVPTATSINDEVRLTIPSGFIFKTSRPLLKGTAPANAQVEVTVNSETQTGIVTANSNGEWEWTPPNPLAEGTHRYFARVLGQSTTTSPVEFIIDADNSLAGTGISLWVGGSVGMVLVSCFVIYSRKFKKKISF